MEQLRKYKINRKKLIKAFFRLEDSLQQPFTEYMQDSPNSEMKCNFQKIQKEIY